MPSNEPSAASPAISGDIPFVGRAGELDRLVDRLGTTDPAAFVIAGPAGVGKTRLAAEVSRLADGFGYRVARVVATSAAASIPLGAFAPLLSEIDVSSGGLLALLQTAGDAIVERVGGGGRVLLVLDDAQLLDDVSAALVLQLVLTGSCSLVASMRTPGALPDPIMSLWKEGHAERIDLQPLGEVEIEQLTVRLLGGPVTGASVRWLWEVSAGNPLYVRELLVGAADSGSLQDDNGMWRLRLPLPAPERLAELVASRLADLPQKVIDVLELLAVGEPLSVSVVEAIAGGAALEQAEEAGLVAERVQDRRAEAGLGHPLYGEVLRRRMPRARHRRLCAALADALRESGARRHDDLLRIAHWQLDAGVRSDPALLTRAAQTARQMFDMELAARLARAALDAGGGAEAGLVLGEAEFSAGHGAEAEAVLAEVIPLCTTDAELALVANARSYNLSVLLGDLRGGLRVAEDALAAVNDPTATLRLRGRLAITSILAGDFGPALEHAAPLLASDLEAMVHRGAFVTSWALAQQGKPEEAVRVAYRGLEAHRHSTDRTQIPEAQLIGAVLAHVAAGHLERAVDDARVGYAAALEAGDTEGTASFSLLHGYVDVDRGLLAAAARHFREGASVNRELSDQATLRFCVGGVALAEGMAGQAEPASEAVRELDELPPHWMAVFDDDLVDRGRAWAAVAAGDLPGGRAILERAARRAAAGGHPIAEAHLLHDLARLGHAGPVEARLGQLSTTVDGDLVPAFAAHAAAVVQCDAELLETAAERFEQLGACLLAAEAWAAASSQHRRAGQARRSTAAGRRAEELLELCGDVRTPGLAAGGDAERLTKRQREVALLAASGVSSREIADRLYLSVRTVDNHLQSAYTKLGVTSREELALALEVV